MPAIIRKSNHALVEVRRESIQAVSWQSLSNVWSPPTDFYETEEGFIVRIEIAGMREEDFEIALEAHSLLISGSRPDLNERRAYHQMEIRFGKFATAVALQQPVNEEEAHAEYKDGFLTVTLPKKNPIKVKVK